MIAFHIYIETKEDDIATCYYSSSNGRNTSLSIVYKCYRNDTHAFPSTLTKNWTDSTLVLCGRYVPHPSTPHLLSLNSYPSISVYILTYPYMSVCILTYPYMSLHIRTYPYISVHIRTYPHISVNIRTTHATSSIIEHIPINPRQILDHLRQGQLHELRHAREIQQVA